MRGLKFCAVVFGLILQGPILLASDTKTSCAEVAETEAKCKEYEAQSQACKTLVDNELKNRMDAAKKEADDCKKKFGIEYVVKCKKEIKNSTTAVNTPKKVAAVSMEKELTGNPETACGKSEQIGKETPLCKGPKKVLDTMKKNCI